MKQSVILIIILFGLTGCVQVTTEGGIDLKKAILHSPEGEIKLELNEPTTISYTYDNKYSFTISLFQSSLLRIGAESKDSIMIDYDNSYYQVNNGEKQKLLIQESAKAYYYKYTPPTEMMLHTVHTSGGDLKNLKGKKLSKSERNAIQKNTYHYYIPVSLDDENYALDITFKLDLDWSLQIGVPGGSP
jgi:hypothetical protein